MLSQRCTGNKSCEVSTTHVLWRIVSFQPPHPPSPPRQTCVKLVRSLGGAPLRPPVENPLNSLGGFIIRITHSVSSS